MDAMISGNTGATSNTNNIVIQYATDILADIPIIIAAGNITIVPIMSSDI